MNNGKYHFSKKLRLLKSDEFDAVFKAAHKITSPYFLVLTKKNNGDFPRLGLIIAKKRVKNAADRNRIKRVIRESFRLHQERLKGFDVVVLAFANAGTEANAVLFNHLEKSWEKLQR